MDFAVATGLCVCGWAGGNWSYFLLILGNAWHSRGRGVHKLYVLFKIRTSRRTKEANTSFSRALCPSKIIYPFKTVMILLGIGCYVNSPCQCLCGWWRQHQVPGVPSWSLGHRWRQIRAENSNFTRGCPCLVFSKIGISWIIWDKNATYSSSLVSKVSKAGHRPTLHSTPQRIKLYHYWAKMFKNLSRKSPSLTKL